MGKPGWRLWLSGCFVAVLAAHVIALGRPSPAAAGTPKQINVILITADTLRADHLGVYGYPRNTSPSVDRFARESTLFLNAFSHAPQTNPSFSSIMTSFYPHETKVLKNHYVLPPSVVTLAEILKAQGYLTAAFVSNPSLRRGAGFEQGFDTYDDTMEDRVPSIEVVERLAPKTTQAAAAWLEANAKHKFFLWVHYNDPHGPYIPPAPYDTMFVEPTAGKAAELPINRGENGKGGIPSYQQLGNHRDASYYISQYDGEIRFLDQSFGEFLQKIRKMGLEDNSLIIFTGDHGEGMGDHNYYFAHREFIYNGLIHIPLVVRLPGKASHGREIRSPVGHVDLLPTILDTVGIRAPRRLRGQNLFAQGGEREIFFETFNEGSKYGVIRNGLKLIQSGGQFELYDLAKDFSERVNLLAQGERLVESQFMKSLELRKRLDAIRKQDLLNLGKPLLWLMDPSTRKQLRSLGYVQ